MAAKRSQSQGSSKDEPPSKKIQGSSSKDNQPLNKSVFLSDPVNIGPVSTEEELDIKVLKFQNAKLYSRLEEKNNQEEEFNNKLAHLERLRQNDRNIISSMNLAWNQLDEDTVLLLKRFQDIPDEARESMSETTVAFLEKLSNRTSKGMREETQKRVNHSGGLIRKLVELIHRVLSRSLDIAKLLHKKKEQVLIFKELKAQRAAKLKQEDGSVSPPSPNDDEAKEEESVFDMSSIDLAVRQENATLKIDNKRLHNTINELHNKNHSLSTEFSVVKDELVTVHKENTELHEKQKEMQYDLQKATKQFEKLIQKLNETAEQAMSGGGGLASTSTKLGIPHQNDDLKHELEAKDELAKSRLNELKKMQETHQKLVEEHEKMKQQMLEVPDEVVINTTKYKVLQTQFNFLFNDAQTIRKNCEDARKILTSNHSQHLSQVGQLENENAQMKKRVRSEVNQLEKALSDSRKELEVLRVEYEHNTKAYEQIVPMSKEMRHLINSLQNHNHQLRDEVQRYKKRITEYDQKTAELEKRLAAGGETPIDYIDRIDIGNSSPRSESSQSSNDESDYDDIKKLRSKLKSAREKRKEMKLLLDMYKGVSKETRDKAELLKNERTLKDEIQVLKAKLLVLTEDAVEQSKRFADDHHKKQCQKLENKIEELQKSIANMKQEEDALLGEMEFTGQAFEEMQEQNIRLLQQLREKDDSNLKLMSERIKANQIQKLLREEKDVLTQQVKVKNEKQMATDELVKKLEEREKILQTALTTLESEANSRMQASECHKRKALEMTTQYQEVLYRTESLNKQLEEATKSMLDKTNRLEEETFKYNRIQEENISLKKKLDRAKKMEFFGASDEILVEEVKLYKGKLMCPCCNTRQKDAIISKCHHVFCYECLKTRYDTRQRKCPKCNGPFGNQDFHKIFM